MSSANPISLAARERLRDHQVIAAKAVATHSGALARLSVATSCRAEIVARQDVLVAAAVAEVASAVAEAAHIMGIDVAAAVLDLSKAEVRRMSKEAR